MGRKAGQIIARGDRTWLVRFYIGRARRWHAQRSRVVARDHLGPATPSP